MKKYFITYGDDKFTAAKAMICEKAKSTGEFDEVIAYGREDLSEELLQSEIINIKRGGGLWSWKPDVILTTMEKYQNGDAIVYCDAGCSIYTSKEWKEYWNKLEHHDIIAQRIYQRTDHWTRKETLDFFKDNGKKWPLCYQYQATIIIIISEFTKRFVREWRDLMIYNSVLAMDVTEKERTLQHKSFIENRHDQAVYSALIYKYLANPNTRSKIYTQWEHIEDYDPFRKQAIRATRLRHGEDELRRKLFKRMCKFFIKHFLLTPLFFAPLQWWHSRYN